MWDNDDIKEGTEYCPKCDSPLNREGYGGNCGGYHEPDCDLCYGAYCDLSC